MMTLDEYFLQYYSAESMPRYKSQIEQYKAYANGKAEQSTYTEIVEYIGYLRERKLHPKTLINHLHSIKIYFRYLVSIGKRNDHPCETLYLKDQINKAIIIESLYSKEELEELYNTFETAPSKKPNHIKSEAIKKRDKIILGLIIYQALTTHEIIHLKVNDIDLNEGTIKINETNLPGRRTNKSRLLALKSKQILLLNDYLKTHRKELWQRQKPSKRKDYLILNESGLQLWGSYLNRMLNDATDHRYSPMKIRQSVIAHLLKENNDIRVVQEFAGHRKTGSTEAYQRTGMEELKANIERLHPRQ
jgi:site-specific recombinase XerD